LGLETGEFMGDDKPGRSPPHRCRIGSSGGTQAAESLCGPWRPGSREKRPPQIRD
jgi:hypothetical protein